MVVGAAGRRRKRKIKILIGGSPCTHWSIAQTKHRETKAEGIGWELFLNYKIALDKYQPDFFLYENNKSMSPDIRAQITEELGVEPVLINSALVSAQNRQRLYWVGKREPDGTYSQVPVEQPEDRGILLRDILETGICWREKGYALTASSHSATAEDMFARRQRNGVAEPVNITTSGKSVTLCGNGGGLGAKTGLYAVPLPEPVNGTVDGKAQCLRATYYKDGIRNLVGNTVDRKTCVAIPVGYTPPCGCDVVVTDHNIHAAYSDGRGNPQGYAVSFPDSKSPSVTAGGAHKMKVIDPVTTPQCECTKQQSKGMWISIPENASILPCQTARPEEVDE